RALQLRARAREEHLHGFHPGFGGLVGVAAAARLDAAPEVVDPERDARGVGPGRLLAPFLERGLGGRADAPERAERVLELVLRDLPSLVAALEVREPGLERAVVAALEHHD